MIFRQELVDQILAGRKTMTRRPVNRENPRSHFWHEKCFYRPGMITAAQANFKPGSTWPRIEITEVRRERWCDITEAEAIAEGFGPPDHSTTRWSARDEFLRYVHGLFPDLDLTSECWVIEFQLVEAGE